MIFSRKGLRKQASHSLSEKAGLLPSRKRVSQGERRKAILDAALEIFSSEGFEAARLDDVARKAGVAKGTLYLYFPDKEALFEQLLASFAEPILAHFKMLAADETRPVPVILGKILDFVQTEVLGSKRERIFRLVIAEGPRFPAIAAFYYRQIISPGREIIRALAARGINRGELPNDALERFPQLFFAPILVAVIWNGMFSKFDELDVAAMFAEHRKIMLGLEKGEGPE